MEPRFLAGADPELMLMDKAGNLISAIGKIRGTKRRPFKVEMGAIQRDNTLAELNITPAPSREDFVGSLRRVLEQLAEEAHPFQLVPQAGANYPEKLLRHREARKFGCDPDYNAWGNGDAPVTINVVPSHAASLPFRSAGGHLHIGYTSVSKTFLLDDWNKIAVVQMLDLFVGLFGVVVDDDPTAKTRRSLYGRAGAHRPKPYGVEYRTLGNFWLRSPELAGLIYELANVAVEQAMQGEDRAKELVRISGGGNKIQKIINENEVEAAREILLGFKALLPKPAFQALRRKKEPMRILAPLPFYPAWGLPQP